MDSESEGNHHTAHNAYGTLLVFKTLIQPSQTSIQRHQQKLKQILQRHQAATQSQLIDALNPVIIGWSNYFSTGVSSHAYQGLDNWLYLRLKNWPTHRHPRKSQHWIAHRYWLIDRGEGWTFAASTPEGIQRLEHRYSISRNRVSGEDIQQNLSISEKKPGFCTSVLARHSHTVIQRHVKVQGQRSVFDADWIYWSSCMGRQPQVNQHC
ncbi:hypothetical protein K9N68_13820 [Kovacikia minuta CCNUW1]|uniref:group II intron maturase-specific domain-containing protein n=1 Tax=Kovacikia minuta TaxID=2931930 RepID=UPI001CC9EE37|nr:group II intron maturase-specific domain-containing protein [Kovacikia minuta]UBF28820.1 hypothetical protein K9N68_13820 [Kovacikia minuta CCNUW1]